MNLFSRKRIFISLIIMSVTGFACQTRSDLQELRDKRSLLRAYNGAPPKVPHSTTQTAYKRCLVCHTEGLTLKSEKDEGLSGRVVAPIVPHPTWLNCIQCHAPQVTDDLFTKNNFEPYRITRVKPKPAEKKEGEETQDGPPPMPHPMQNRENCRVCHFSSTAPSVLRPPHEDRDGCQFCHQPDEKAVIYND